MKEGRRKNKALDWNYRKVYLLFDWKENFVARAEQGKLGR